MVWDLGIGVLEIIQNMGSPVSTYLIMMEKPGIGRPNVGLMPVGGIP